MKRKGEKFTKSDIKWFAIDPKLGIRFFRHKRRAKKYDYHRKMIRQKIRTCKASDIPRMKVTIKNGKYVTEVIDG